MTFELTFCSYQIYVIRIYFYSSFSDFSLQIFLVIIFNIITPSVGLIGKVFYVRSFFKVLFLFFMCDHFARLLQRTNDNVRVVVKRAGNKF